VWLNRGRDDKTIFHLTEALGAAYRELEYAHSRITLPRDSAATTLNGLRLDATAQYEAARVGSLGDALNGNGVIEPDIEPDLERIL
jgi:hypothetical protein